MIAEEFLNFIRREISRAFQMRAEPTAAVISAYDPNTHSIKAIMQPSGVETGWLRHGMIGIGSGFGIAVGPTIGDQIMLGFHDGNIEAPYVINRLPSDQENPPVVQSGEILVKHSTGASLHFGTDGTMTQTGAAGGTIVIDPSGNVNIN